MALVLIKFGEINWETIHTWLGIGLLRNKYFIFIVIFYE